jgi:hypothetical protein
MDAARDELDGGSIVAASPRQRRELLSRSREHAMQGLVARSVRRLPTLEPWAFEFVQQAIGVREGHARHARTLKLAATELEAHAIPRLVVKGASLVERYYHDTALRPYGDVDMLVPPGDFREGLAVLERGGFKILDRNWDMLRADLRGQLHMRSPEGDVLELHWHPVNSSRVRRALALSPDELWCGATTARIADAEVNVPSPPRELAHLCEHAAMHGCDRLIWLVDISKVAATPGLDLDELTRTARRWGFGAGIYLVLALADRWLGIGGSLDSLRELRPDRVTMTTFHRLVSRWDLGHPGADARFRQLLFATAGDGAVRRARLTWSLIVPPDVRNPEEPTTILEHGRRMTIGAASRVRHKLNDHAQDGLPLEYRSAGDPVLDRELYVQQVESWCRTARIR